MMQLPNPEEWKLKFLALLVSFTNESRSSMTELPVLKFKNLSHVLMNLNNRRYNKYTCVLLYCRSETLC